MNVNFLESRIPTEDQYITLIDPSEFLGFSISELKAKNFKYLNKEENQVDDDSIDTSIALFLCEGMRQKPDLELFFKYSLWMIKELYSTSAVYSMAWELRYYLQSNGTNTDVINQLFEQIQIEVEQADHIILKSLFYEYAVELFIFGAEYDVFYDENAQYSTKKSVFLNKERPKDILSTFLYDTHLKIFQSWQKFSRI